MPHDEVVLDELLATVPVNEYRIVPYGYVLITSRTDLCIGMDSVNRLVRDDF
jgi:hypothetical protein